MRVLMARRGLKTFNKAAHRGTKAKIFFPCSFVCLRLSVVSFALLLSSICLLASRANAQATTPENVWPQFRGNSQLTAASHAFVPRDLRLLWTYEAGESIESSAAIVDGTVYVGSQSGDLVALDLGDGSVR